jgi:hypothetical protein
MNKISALFLAVILCAIVVPAFAGTYFEENFDSYETEFVERPAYTTTGQGWKLGGNIDSDFTAGASTKSVTVGSPIGADPVTGWDLYSRPGENYYSPTAVLAIPLESDGVNQALRFDAVHSGGSNPHRGGSGTLTKALPTPVLAADSDGIVEMSYRFMYYNNNSRMAVHLLDGDQVIFTLTQFGVPKAAEWPSGLTAVYDSRDVSLNQNNSYFVLDKSLTALSDTGNNTTVGDNIKNAMTAAGAAGQAYAGYNGIMLFNGGSSNDMKVWHYLKFILNFNTQKLDLYFSKNTPIAENAEPLVTNVPFNSPQTLTGVTKFAVNTPSGTQYSTLNIDDIVVQNPDVLPPVKADFTIEGAEYSFAGGEVTVNSEIGKTGDYGTAAVIAAVYGADGELIGVDIQSLIDAETDFDGDTMSYTKSVSVAGGTSPQRVALYLWDSVPSMKQIQSVECTVSAVGE